MNKKLLLYIFSICLLAVVLGNVFCNSSKNVSNEIYLNHNDTVKYVGMNQCASCHADIYKSFIQTGMGQSFGVATKQKSSATFYNKAVVFDKHRNFYYHPFWQNDSMYIMEFRLKGKDTIYKRVERVDYIIGSGQHTNSHLTKINGYIYQLPLTWYAQKKYWDLPPGFENGRNIRFSRNIDVECMSCHNAMPVVEPKNNNKFISIGNGIDCERCHGPGEIHVKEKLAGIVVDTSNHIDYSIVNPKKLSWQLQVDVCQRCHLQGNAVLKDGKSFTDFKPGKKLSDFVDVFMPKFDGNNQSFIMAGHAQRLQMSKCFIESNKESHTKTGSKKYQNLNLTCITCHNPHVSVKVTGKQIFNNACISCHQNNDGCSENQQLLLAQNYNCVSCHMPKNGTEDIPHVTVHDHYIRKPEKKLNFKDISVFAGLYCVNNQQTSVQSKTIGYLQYFEKFEGNEFMLDSAWRWMKLLDGNQSVQYKIHYYYLKNQFDMIIPLANQLKDFDAWTAYRVGQAFKNTGDFFSAEIWYQKAVDLSNNDIQFLNKLASSKILNNKFSEAVNILTKSILQQPKQEDALINLGFAYLKLNNTLQALQYYNKALALNPDNTQGLFNRAAIHRLNGNKNACKSDLLHLYRLQPQNQEIKAMIDMLNIK